MAKTDNFEDDEVNDTSKTPLERPLEAIKSNKRSEIDTTESNDKVGKLEGNSSLGKMEQETAKLNMAASVVEESAKLRYKFLSLEDNVDTGLKKISYFSSISRCFQLLSCSYFLL